MSSPTSNRDERLPFVYAALRQALAVTGCDSVGEDPTADYLWQAAGRFMSFVDLPPFVDRNASRALAAVTLGLMRQSRRGVDADLRAVLDSAADLLDAIRCPETAVDPSQACPFVQLALQAFQLGHDSRRVVAQCLSRVAEERVDDIYLVLSLPNSPVIAWLEGKDSVGSLPPQPRIQTVSVGAQHSPAACPVDHHSRLVSGLSDTAMVNAVSAAIIAAAQVIAKPMGPADVVEEGDLPKRFLPETAPKFIPLQPKGTADSGEEDWVAETASPLRLNQRQKRLLWVATGTLAALAFIFGTTVDFRGRRSARVATSPAQVINGASAASEQTPREVAEQFLYSEEHSQRVALLRDRRHARLMREHFETMATRGAEDQVESLRPVRTAIIQGMHQHRFHVTFRDGRTRFLALVEESGGLYVDWLAYARLGSASWADLLGGAVHEAEMRCLVTPCQYYNFAFGDAERYQAYKITSPDSEVPLYGYVERRTRRDRILASAVAGSRRRLTLTLRSLRDSHAHQQFAISCVNGLGWANAEQDFEGSPYAEPLPVTASDGALPLTLR